MCVMHEFKVRFRNHKSSMLNNRRTCELVVDYNSSEHDISQISFIVIEQISTFQNHLDFRTIVTDKGNLLDLTIVHAESAWPQ